MLALEGLCYAVAPEIMRRALVTLVTQPAERLRIGGLVAAGGGIALGWLLLGR